MWENSTSDESHPLEALKTDERVQNNLERSRAWAAEASKEIQKGREVERTPSDENNNRSADKRGQETDKRRPDMFEMSMADGTTLQVPTEWAMHMAAVDKKLR